ncbi:MutS-related protein [Halorubrum sp. DTA98]|uniref:MutS-related protein n=1 Tax=Halorubrum sp. DTA98 TaxID=3402163 RepID=UPI003AAC7631
MRLEDYWGIGPKTSETLRDRLGVDRSLDAIESADVRTLVDAGIPRGRATRILRRANGEAGMDVLATGDSRSVYDDLLSLAASYAVTDHAGDRIRVLTPLTDREAIASRLDEVVAARDAWRALDDVQRERLLDAFAEYDAAGGSDRAAVETALLLRDIGLDGDTFDGLDGLDDDALRDAAGALGYLRGPLDGDPGELTVVDGADEALDRRRERLDAARALESSAFDVIDSVRDGSVRDFEAFTDGVVSHVAGETGIDPATIRSATPDEAVDAADFVSGTLRTLVADLETTVSDREADVATELRSAVGETDGDVDRAVDAVSDIAVHLSLGRFAAEHDLVRPRLIEDGLAVRNARSLFIGDEVQPVSYGIGTHTLADGAGFSGRESPPSGDRVSVLTGANSGGKTTLLETLCTIALLTSMGLPVPAEEAAVGRFDRIVFHRRHASFNAGVLESTLKSVVPPLVEDGRTLMLVDEFEAITEPGRAADLLNGLVDLTVDRAALGVYVTHLADDLSPLPDAARIDGIFAEGLTNDLELRVDYQPRFGTVGKSTPEFIVSRLVANATDRGVRGGFEHLAMAVGEEAVQRTLSDARWTPDDE